MRSRKDINGVIVLVAIATASIWEWSCGGGGVTRPDPIAAPARTASAESQRVTLPRVTLDELRPSRVGVMHDDRDPFTFQQHVPVPVQRPVVRPADRAVVVPSPMPPPQVPAPPIRFIGSLVVRNSTWAILSDCAGYTAPARRGESFLGEWEVLRVDAASVLVERHGSAPTRIPMTGCAPR